MGSGPYLAVLFVGAVIVIIDGQIILRTSPSYLAQAYHDPQQARRVARLVTVLYHLVGLGLVALVASVGFSPDAGMPSILSRIGVLLILTAICHGATILAMSRLREQQTGAELAEAEIEASHDAHRRTAAPPRPRRDAGVDIPPTSGAGVDIPPTSGAGVEVPPTSGRDVPPAPPRSPASP